MIDFDRLRERARRIPWAGLGVRVVERYGKDGGGYLAASITFYLFVAAVPLALLAISATGFTLRRLGAEDQAQMIERIAAEVPALGPVIKDNLNAITSFATPTGLIAILGIIWGASGAINSLRHALGRIFGFDPEGSFIGVRLKGLGFLAVLLIDVLITTAVTALALSVHGIVITAVLLVAAAVFDFGVAFLAFRVFTPKDLVASRDLVAGSFVVGIGYGALGLLGSWYTKRVVLRASLVFGTLAGLIGILVLLNLTAVILLYGAELAALLRDERPDTGATSPA